MKIYRLLFFSIIALSAPVQAFQPAFEIVEHFDDLKTVAFIPKEEINKNPEWDPALSEPPVSVLDAIQAIKEFSKTPVIIDEIEIRQVPRHQGQWHYLIKVSNDAMKYKFSIYVVLMSGKVIPAIIEPETYK